jgi:C-terminal processing protease CtpA/Prc
MRDEVSIPSVTSEVIEKNGKNLLYIEISIISEKTTALLLEEVREALETAGKIDGIILDLR